MAFLCGSAVLKARTGYGLRDVDIWSALIILMFILISRSLSALVGENFWKLTLLPF